MELNEIIAVPQPHPAGKDECPFCPAEPPPKFTTHGGLANDGDKLGKIMNDPDELEKDARPKKGQPDQQAESTPQPRADAQFSTSKDGEYSYEAHHLVSGKQALAAGDHNFEQWIISEKGTIKKDTGYSVNNADNGIWAPSIPEKFKGGKWGSKDYAVKYGIAKLPMAAGQCQFHKGHHAVKDPDDPDGLKHETYDKYLKDMLKAMSDRMHLWSVECSLCKKDKNDQPKKPFQPSVRVNQVLDNLSKVARRRISAPATNWEIFISRYALDYHKDGHCEHTED